MSCLVCWKDRRETSVLHHDARSAAASAVGENSQPSGKTSLRRRMGANQRDLLRAPRWYTFLRVFWEQCQDISLPPACESRLRCRGITSEGRPNCSGGCRTLSSQDVMGSIAPKPHPPYMYCDNLDASGTDGASPARSANLARPTNQHCSRPAMYSEGSD